MAYTLEKIQKEFINICVKAGVQVGSVPIQLNGRLTKTLGRVTSIQSGSRYKPSKVEFSKLLLETSTDKSIKEVIAHEAAHFIATSRTGEPHGHDAYFKAICAEIGTTNNGTSTNVERTVPKEELYKYGIYCSNCGYIGGYTRMCKTLKEISEGWCSCRKCNDNHLRIQQNW